MIKTTHEENYDALLWYAMRTLKGYDGLPVHVQEAVRGNMMPELDRELPVLEALKKAHNEELARRGSRDTSPGAE